MQASWYLGSELHKVRWRGRHALTLERESSNLLAFITRAERLNHVSVWQLDVQRETETREPFEIARQNLPGG